MSCCWPVFSTNTELSVFLSFSFSLSVIVNNFFIFFIFFVLFVLFFLAPFYTVILFFPLYHLVHHHRLPPHFCTPKLGLDLSLDLSGDFPVPDDRDQPQTPLTPEEIQRILRHEEEEHRREEERLRKRDEEKRRRRKERKEQEERQRKLVEEKRRAEEEALRLQLEKEEDEWRKQIEEMERRRREQEEEQRRKVAAEREAREKERKLEEEMRQRELLLREELLAFNGGKEVQQQQEDEEEEEEEVWLRGDVFQMYPKEPEEPDLEPSPIPKPPAAAEEEDEKMESEIDAVEAGETVVKDRSLPPGCDISDVTLTCDNAKLTYFPPLSIPELKSLSLEGKIPKIQFNRRFFHYWLKKYNIFYITQSSVYTVNILAS